MTPEKSDELDARARDARRAVVDALRNLAERYGVEIVYAFGSRAAEVAQLLSAGEVPKAPLDGPPEEAVSGPPVRRAPLYGAPEEPLSGPPGEPRATSTSR